MKKVILLICITAFAWAGNMQAQGKMKIAVMDFKPGVGVSEATVDGISEMLISSLFDTRKFSIIERTQLDQAIKEQGFQKSSISAGQIAKVGKVLGVRYVLIGTVNFIVREKTPADVATGMAKGEYNIDIRIVDVESGEIVSTAGVEQRAGETTRDLMPKLAKELVGKLTGDGDGDGYGEVVTLMGYLKVYPEVLGPLSCDASTGRIAVLDQINAANSYGSASWYLPNADEVNVIYQALRSGRLPALSNQLGVLVDVRLCSLNRPNTQWVVNYYDGWYNTCTHSILVHK
jgi:hypothetical protein